MQRPWDSSMLGISKLSKDISVASDERISELTEEAGKGTPRDGKPLGNSEQVFQR